MARPQPFPKPTFEEFLEMEATTEVRHEYVAGDIYAVVGGSKNHNRLVLNVASRLLAKHDDGECRVYVENILLRMKLGENQIGYYPDVMLVCDPADEPGELYAERPCALIEVLSDSTQHVDRGDKFRDYKTLDSLKIYLLVSQQAVHVTLYRRANDWRPEMLTRLDDVISFDCAPGEATSLTLAEIYRGLDFAI